MNSAPMATMAVDAEMTAVGSDNFDHMPSLFKFLELQC